MVRIWTMDNRKRLEMMDFHTRGHLTKIQRQVPISRRMVGQLLTLIDLFILANYHVSYKVAKVLQTCLRDIFGTCLNRMIIDRMRKTRRHDVVLACVVAWFGISHGWRSLSSSFMWKEASFGFRKMTWQWMSTFAVSGNCYSLECCFITDDENLLSWNVGWWYRRGTETLVSAPLHLPDAVAHSQRAETAFAVVLLKALLQAM